MIAVLNSYLVQHKSVSIPGLGTIYVERTPAQSDFVNKQILSPSYHYRFDKYVDSPDKDFFTYLAAQKGIADYEAIKLYSEWAYEFRNKIRNDQAIEWDEVGTLLQDPSGEINFEPKSSITSYLLPVPAVRVIRSNTQHIMLVGDKEVSNVKMSEFLSEETHVAKESWWIYALIIGAISLVAIFFYFQRHGISIESTSNQHKIFSK